MLWAPHQVNMTRGMRALVSGEMFSVFPRWNSDVYMSSGNFHMWVVGISTPVPSLTQILRTIIPLISILNCLCTCERCQYVRVYFFHLCHCRYRMFSLTYNERNECSRLRLVGHHRDTNTARVTIIWDRQFLPYRRRFQISDVPFKRSRLFF